MLKAEYLKASPEAKEAYICKFVDQLQSRFERETKPDRDRWALAQSMFTGKGPVNAERAANSWMSAPFFPEMTATVRRMAAALQDLIFERKDFFNLVPRGMGEEEFARIVEKVIRSYIEKINFENSSYEYFLIGGVYGLAVRKLAVCPELEWTPEIVIERIGEEQAKDKKRLGKDVIKTGQHDDLPNDPDAIEGRIRTALDELLGESEPTVKRKLSPQRRLKLKVALEYPNLFNFFYDPDARDVNCSSMFIERHFKRYFELVPLVDSGVVAKEKLEKVKGTSFGMGEGGVINLNSTYEGQKLGQRDQFAETSNDLPIIEVLEYYGPLLDSQGDIIEENRVYLVANRKILLRDAQNGYFSQKAPYHAAVFSRVPFKPVGQGVADAAIEQNILINDLFGLWLDLMRLAVYSPKTFDKSKVNDPRQVEGYLKPGQLIDVMDSSEQIFKDIPFNVNGVGGPLFQTIEALRLSGEKGTGVDATSANPSSRARISATEISSNANRASQTFLAIAREVDANYIIPTIMALFEMVLQFGFENDALTDLVTDGVLTQSEFDLVAQIPQIERYNEIKRNYRVSIKGFRERLERDDFLAKTNELLSVMTRIPPNAINVTWSAILKQLLEALNFDTDAVLPQNTPQDKAREENSILMRPGNQQITVGEQDDHAAEAPVHYEAALQNPVPGLLQHIMGHIQASGGNLPPPPPQLAQMLGIPPQAQADQAPPNPQEEMLQ